MRAYNVEFFDSSFELKHRTNVSRPDIDSDYLSIEENTVTILSTDEVEKDMYIRLHCLDIDEFGIVTGLENQNDVQLIVSYKPLTTLFEQKVLINTSYQNNSEMSLEQTIADAITDNWISNTDTSKNIPLASVEVLTETVSWTLNLTPTDSGMTYCICNFYDSVITAALSKYKIAVTVVPDYQNKTIVFQIGANEQDTEYLETDMPNILSKSVNVGEVDIDINKLTVYDSTDYTSYITYYLHSDFSYDTTDDDRLTPVYENIVSVDVDDDNTLEDLASEQASSTFSSYSYDNLIEIECMEDDSAIEPLQMAIGQQVNIISEGVQYTSILTGRKISDTVTLIFGTIRLDLTKILKGGK